jgi:hypothetical protein
MKKTKETRGRPAMAEDEKRVKYSATMKPELIELVDGEAVTSSRSRSQQIEYIIAQHFEINN